MLILFNLVYYLSFRYMLVSCSTEYCFRPAEPCAGTSQLIALASLHFLLLFLLVVWVLDSQAPDIEMIADRDDNVNLDSSQFSESTAERSMYAYHEASVHTHCNTQHQEQIRDLVDTSSQSRRPSKSNMRFQPRSKRVNNSKSQWQD